MSEAAMTPRLSETDLRPASLPGVSLIMMLLLKRVSGADVLNGKMTRHHSSARTCRPFQWRLRRSARAAPVGRRRSHNLNGGLGACRDFRRNPGDPASRKKGRAMGGACENRCFEGFACLWIAVRFFNC